VNGPTSAGIDDRVNTGIAVNGTVSNPTLATVPAYDPRIVAVPLVDFTGATGSSVQLPVRGFALMWLQSYTSKGAQCPVVSHYPAGPRHHRGGQYRRREGEGLYTVHRTNAAQNRPDLETDQSALSRKTAVSQTA
jgi:hypothetical protein